MKVYLVYEAHRAEPPVIIGVYKTLLKAQEVKNNAQKEFDKACKQVYDHVLESGEIVVDMSLAEYLEEAKEHYEIGIEEIEVQE